MGSVHTLLMQGSCLDQREWLPFWAHVWRVLSEQNDNPHVSCCLTVRQLEMFHWFGGGGVVTKLCPTLATSWTCQVPLSVQCSEAFHIHFCGAQIVSNEQNF